MSLKEKKAESGYLCTRWTATAQLHAHAQGRLTVCPFWRNPERLFSPGPLACLVNLPEHYTYRIKQGYNRRDGSFQSSCQPERGSLVGVCAQDQVEAERLNPD
ncbi:hypothetical protein ILYODFUR_035543 [Ilyodon furcidens]|uniref:Uncharacterized protein n=1 Tax=Ilyodon furcidens TaxID=33524 RepID=A0ABV0SS75_9TELE